MREPEAKVGFSAAKILWALVGGAAAGAATGAAIMYLNAPRAGAQSRAKLQSLAGNTRDVVTRAPHALRDATVAAQRAFTKTFAKEIERS
jgi:gas vesicle protein